MTDHDQRLSRHRGALLGLAVGDALGTTVEFARPGTFRPVTDMVGGGPFRLKPGQWTDDTSMALCLAASLIERRGFDPADQMQRYLRWRDAGYLSSNGRCFDIGNTVSDALRRFERSGDPYSGSTDPHTAGNGSLMRLAPVAMAFAHDPEGAVRYAAEMSRTTHGAAEAVDACRYYCGLLVGALNGAAKADLLAPRFAPLPGLWDREPLAPAIDEVAGGSFLHREPPEIAGLGYVVKSLEAALWALARGDSFEGCVLKAVNLGHDADTTGAICGMLAGAIYGVDAIPARWRLQLAKVERIERFARELARESAAHPRA
ncbi:MAG TPA: ADP-ribosylglycohydrolase family protein [Pseudomonadales bacterium]